MPCACRWHRQSATVGAGRDAGWSARNGVGDWRERMRLRTGQVAPSFQAIDIYGRRVALSQYRGTNLLLSFNRAAVCPLCNIRTWHLINRYVMYQRLGLHIIAFYESAPGRSHSYLDRLEAPFPIIADLERNIYSLYGLESSWLGAVKARLTRLGMYHEAAAKTLGGNVLPNVYQMDGRFRRLPADFLVGPDLRIRLAHYGQRSEEHTSELQSLTNLVCRLLLEKKKTV